MSGGNYKQYLLLRNIGVWSFSFLGGSIIDRCMPNGEVEAQDFAKYLNQVRHRFDWNKDEKGDRSVSGMSGNRAALIIAGEMAEELTDETGNNLMREIQERLKAQVASRK